MVILLLGGVSAITVTGSTSFSQNSTGIPGTGEHGDRVVPLETCLLLGWALTG